MRTNAAAVKLEIADSTGRDVRIVLGDLASLSVVCQLADAFKRRFSRLDALMNNAGSLSRLRTVEGARAFLTYSVAASPVASIA